jgi:hypothetical protein
VADPVHLPDHSPLSRPLGPIVPHPDCAP